MPQEVQKEPQQLAQPVALDELSPDESAKKLADPEFLAPPPPPSSSAEQAHAIRHNIINEEWLAADQLPIAASQYDNSIRIPTMSNFGASADALAESLNHWQDTTSAGKMANAEDDSAGSKSTSIDSKTTTTTTTTVTPAPEMGSHTKHSYLDTFRSAYGEYSALNASSAKNPSLDILEHIFNAPARSSGGPIATTALSELLLRQQKDVFQHWQKVDDADRNPDRDELLARVYGSNVLSQQKCNQQQQLLATQLLYARFLQPQLSEPERNAERALHIVELPGSKNSSSLGYQEAGSSTVPSYIMGTSQDNNNNNRILNDIERGMRCSDEPLIHRLPQPNPSSEKSNHPIRKSETHTKDNCDSESNSYFFKEQKNILSDVKKGLEQLTLLSSQFRETLVSRHHARIHGNEYGDNDTALDATVKRQLDGNSKTVEGMLTQVRRLYHQWSSAELYYLRSLQRLGLKPDDETGSGRTPTHAVMALAAIALSAECEVAFAEKVDQTDARIIKKGLRKQEPKSESELPKFPANTGKARTLQDIENFILQQASTVVTQESNRGSSPPNGHCDSGNSDSEESTPVPSPMCIWHPKSRGVRLSGEIEICTTAAEVILEYASLASESKANALRASSLFTTSMAGADTSESSPASNTPPGVARSNREATAAAVSSVGDSSYLADIQFPPTPTTPPTSSNSSCSTGTLAGSAATSSKCHRRKSRYARRIETPTSSSTSSGTTVRSNCQQEYSSYNIDMASLPVSPSASATATSTTPPVPVVHGASSAMAAVTALQERALTDMFKARFSALTAAAAIGSGSGNGVGDKCEAVPMADAPYDLSIGTRLKNM